MSNVQSKRAATGSSFASPALRALFRQRTGEIIGLGLALVGIALLIVLVTYDVRDPSFNTATSRVPGNMGGPLGATIADLLLQGLGLAALLPSAVLLTWAWRLGAARGVSRVWTRAALGIFALPMLAGVLAIPVVVSGAPMAWPASAGPGGAVGSAIAGGFLHAGRSVFGPLGMTIFALALIGIAGVLTILALGLSAMEWRGVGVGAVKAAKVSLVQGKRASAVTGYGFSALLARVRALTERRKPQSDRDIRAFVAPEPDTLVRREPAVVMPSLRTAPSPDEVVVPPSIQPVATKSAVRPVMRPRAATAVSSAAQASLPLEESGWRFPSVALLQPAPVRAAAGPSAEALEGTARLLESVLKEFGVQGTIVEIRPGPVVTLYEFEPAPGIRSARVIGLADDVARTLSVTAVRIATVPGRNVIGIEVPNAKRETVYFSELLGTEAFEGNSGKLVLALGKDIGGAPVMTDLAKMPHLMIAGTTGSGKSVGVNSMIVSLLYRLSPDQCRMILIDPKMLELSVYEGIPHLLSPVVTEPAKAVMALKWVVREMDRRYRQMSQLGVRNVGGYNERVAEARAKGEVVTRRVQTGFDPDTGRPTFEEQPLALEILPFIVVVVDEMADLMMTAGKEIDIAVQRLAQKARAAGIHVIMATQRPSVDVITGTIKANFPTRISFQVISKFDSRTILGEQGAEQLLGQGDMLFMEGGGRIKRVHGPFVSDREVEDIVAFLRAQGEPAYVEDVTEGDPEEGGGSGSGSIGSIADAGEGEKALFDQAVALVAREGKASTSFIQRHLAIGYNRAAKLIEMMEKEGIVSAANHVGKREVLARRTPSLDDTY